MGCGGSKGGKSEDFKMAETKVPEFDELFQSANEPLQCIQDVEKGLNKALADFEKHCHVACIKDHTFQDAVMVMMYCFSASGDGDLSKLNPEVKDKSPFIKVDKKKLKPEHVELANAWDHLVEQLCKVPDKCEPIKDTIETLV
jgi:dGTP triphosphohydrolase